MEVSFDANKHSIRLPHLVESNNFFDYFTRSMRYSECNFVMGMTNLHIIYNNPGDCTCICKFALKGNTYT